MSVSEYYRPTSVGEAVGLLGQLGPDTLVLAGGTVAMPLVNDGLAFPERIVSLRGVGMDYVEQTGDGLRIGAGCRLAALAALHDVPVLRDAATRAGTLAVRNMATVGGNLFTPPPGGDVAVALLALDARVVIEGPSGRRTLPIDSFWTGFMTTALEPSELVVEIEVPRPAGRTGFVKFGRRASNTPAIVTVAARIGLDGDVVTDARIALGAVGPSPFRARGAEARLEGMALDAAAVADAARIAADESAPATDAIATEWYRRRMTVLFVERVLGELAERFAVEGN